MRTPRITLAACIASLVGAAEVSSAQATVPIRDTKPIEATSVNHFGNIFGVRELAGGKVLVNDGMRRQLLVLDAALAHSHVVLDSTPDTGNSYGPKPAPLIPFAGDSSLFIDGNSGTLLVVNREGVISNVRSAPKTSDLRFLSMGASGVDPRGNLVYRGGNGAQAARKGGANNPAPNPPSATPVSDSAPLVRANFETRAIDTIARVSIQTAPKLTMERDATGRVTSKLVSNPVSMVDEWALLTDGTVAIVRGHDYHVDLIAPNGQLQSAPKMAFDWKQLSDADKQALIDSTRIEQARVAAEKRVAAAANGKDFEIMVSAKSGGKAAAISDAGPPGASRAATGPELTFVPLNQISDYYPPIRVGAAKADVDGNLWVLPTTSAQSKRGELVYDVVNNKGELIQRVRLPVGRSIAGFGRDGVLYLMYKDGVAGWKLERTRIGSASTTG